MPLRNDPATTEALYALLAAAVALTHRATAAAEQLHEQGETTAGRRGVLLSLQHLVAPGPPLRRRAPGVRLVQRLLTFHLVCFGWILFRSPSLAVMERILAGFASDRPFAASRAASLALLLLPLAALFHVSGSAEGVRARFVRLSPWVQGAAYAVAVALVFCFSPATEGFIYFQF